MVDIGLQETVHEEKLAHRVPKTTASLAANRQGKFAGPFETTPLAFLPNQLLANCIELRHSCNAVNLLLNQHYLWASCIWSAVASGYWVYGWRQKSLISFLGGLAMMAASILIVSALLMSLASLAIMIVVWWLLRQGY
jgi:hypothetical protein